MNNPFKSRVIYIPGTLEFGKLSLRGFRCKLNLALIVLYLNFNFFNVNRSSLVHERSIERPVRGLPWIKKLLYLGRERECNSYITPQPASRLVFIDVDVFGVICCTFSHILLAPFSAHFIFLRSKAVKYVFEAFTTFQKILDTRLTLAFDSFLFILKGKGKAVSSISRVTSKINAH